MHCHSLILRKKNLKTYYRAQLDNVDGNVRLRGNKKRKKTVLSKKKKI